MNQPAAPQPAPADAEPLFDVRARRAEGQSLEELQERLVCDARLTPEKAEALVGALRAGPSVVLGRSVQRDRADKARLLMKAGLVIEITPVLSLAPKVAADEDGRSVCPACGEVSVLGPQRQCPHCGVYVDKVNPERQLRRKLQEQEKARLAFEQQHRQRAEASQRQAQLEARLREEIRAELAAAHGLLRQRRPDWRDTLRQPRVAAGMGLSFCLSFAAGWWLPQWAAPAAADAPLALAMAASQPVAVAALPKDLDQLLARIDQFGPAAGPAGPGASGVPGLPGDADSLRPVLASAGDTATSPEQRLTLALPAADGLPAPAASQAWPEDLVPQLRAELAVALARAGQGSRAAEALGGLEPWRSSSDPGLAALLRRTRLLVDAWGLQDLAAGAAAPRLAQLRNGLRELVDPIERAGTLAELAPVLAHAPAVPAEVVTGLLTQAGSATKAVADEALRRQLADTWTLAEAATLQAWAEREAATGHTSRLRARAQALAALLPQAQEPATQARLLAAQLRLAQLAGEPTQRLLAAWQTALDRVGPLALQAEVLRDTAQPGQPAADEARRLAQRMAGRADGADAAGRARTLGQLSLLWADAGQAEAQAQLRQRALHTAGLSPDAVLRLRAQLLAGGQIAQAQAALRGGDYARAETHWRAVASYLL